MNFILFMSFYIYSIQNQNKFPKNPPIAAPIGPPIPSPTVAPIAMPNPFLSFCSSFLLLSFYNCCYNALLLFYSAILFFSDSSLNL